MDLKLDFTAEAASPQAVIDYSETVLESGSHLVVITVGAFADAVRSSWIHYILYVRTCKGVI